MSDFLIQLAIQTLLGLIAVGLQNPKSTTFNKFKKPLRIVRDSLLALPLDDAPPLFGVPIGNVKADNFAEAVSPPDKNDVKKQATRQMADAFHAIADAMD